MIKEKRIALEKIMHEYLSNVKCNIPFEVYTCSYGGDSIHLYKNCNVISLYQLSDDIVIEPISENDSHHYLTNLCDHDSIVLPLALIQKLKNTLCEEFKTKPQDEEVKLTREELFIGGVASETASEYSANEVKDVTPHSSPFADDFTLRCAQANEAVKTQGLATVARMNTGGFSKPCDWYTLRTKELL